MGILKRFALNYKDPRGNYLKYLQALTELEREFHDLSHNTLKKCALGFLGNPRETALKIRQSIQELTWRFSDELSSDLIRRLVLDHPSDPAAAAEKYIQTIKRLRREYPHIDQYVLKYTVLANRNPEAAIARHEEAMRRLMLLYPGIPEARLKWYALYHPSNPEGAIEKRIAKEKGAQPH